MKKIGLVIILLLFIAKNSHADTVYLKDKEESKGLVVDDFSDRIILSTADGEKTIMKSDIEDIKYDTVEQTYFQLGKEFEKRNKYREAIMYYEKSLNENPNFTEAKNALTHAKINYWKEDQEQIQGEMQRKMALLNYKDNRTSGVSQNHIKDKDRLLKRKFGIALDEIDGWPRVANVVAIELSDRIKKADLLVVLWGNQTRFTNLGTIVDKLLSTTLREVNVIIERKIDLRSMEYPSSLKKYGLILFLEIDGLTIKNVVEASFAEKDGLKKSDVVVAIANQPTRYMPMNNAIKLIEKSKEPVSLTIRRNIFLPRRD